MYVLIDSSNICGTNWNSVCGDCDVCLLAVGEIHWAFGSRLHTKTVHKVQ